MSRPRIALLNASYEGAETRRNFRRELDADLVEFRCREGDIPDTFAFDGCVITGSKASVYWEDEQDWIEPLESWVAAAVDRGMPALGVCFGHQLLADALGGEVEGMDEYEIGYRRVEHDGENDLLDGIDREFTVFTTHSDRVVEPPPGATVFARNDYGIHGFRKGPAFAVQFHPEYDMATAESVTRGKDLPDEKLRRALDGIDADNYAAACEAKRLFANFTAHVRDVRAAESAAAD